MKQNKIISKFLLIICILFSACSAYAKESVPYIVSGEVVLSSEASEFNAAGFEFYFLNKSEKTVKKFTLVFFLFDEDGEPISNGRSNIVISVEHEIEGNDYLTACLSLDKYLNEIPEVPYEVDYLYVSKIEYVDGSDWDDPLGMLNF